MAILNVEEMEQRAGLACVSFEVVYQLRWMCAATLVALTLPHELQFSDVRHLLPEHLDLGIADLRVTRNHIQVLPSWSVGISYRLQVLVWDTAVSRIFGEDLG